MSKRIDQLTAATDNQVKDLTWLHIIGDPATGHLYKATGNQLKNAFSFQTYLYTSTGTEGLVLTVAAVTSATVLFIQREGTTIYKVASAPNESEFTQAGATITLGTAVSGIAGERFLIIYNNV